MWTLILLAAMGFRDGGVSVHHVANFSSQEACMAAAQVWLDNAGKLRTGNGDTLLRVTAVCVRN